MSDKQPGELALGASRLVVATGPDGSTIDLRGADAAAWRCVAPVVIEHFDGATRQTLPAGYDELRCDTGAITGITRLRVGGGELLVEDRWSAEGDSFFLDRVCRVLRPGSGGFAAFIRFEAAADPRQTRVFAPGMIYGGPDHLTPAAIGGADTWSQGRPFSVLIREDRLPAPLIGIFAHAGAAGGVPHLTCFDAAPAGDCPYADSHDTALEPLLVDGMALAALGFEGGPAGVAAVACIPANEGEVTYTGVTFPDGQVRRWRRRYQALSAGCEIRVRLGWRLSAEPTFPAFVTGSWRSVYNWLAPRPAWHDIQQVTDTLVRRMASLVVDMAPGGRGMPNYLNLRTKLTLPLRGVQAAIGFTGKSLEAANFLLRWADDHPDPEGDAVRREAEAIIASMIRLQVDPPEGEGFYLDTGKPALAFPSHGRVYLRSFGDDMKSLARAFLRERAQGRAHLAWAAWLERFAAWLLTQQRPDGSFPRAWEPETGQVIDPSPSSTYNPIPFLALLAEITGDGRYLAAALRAGEFCWRSGHADFVFVGGTIDNPDIIDKEAGTLSLEAYLALAAATDDRVWVDRAETAARFAETWIYLWNAPISPDEDNSAVHWKRGASTVGLQLIATGHSLVDAYMAFDVDEYARLYALTGDAHYLDVARLLLHGTKSMISLPGRLYDLGEAGWQQEHWSIAPPRGYGLVRCWLPWVTTSHLAGIYDLKDFSLSLYRELTKPESALILNHACGEANAS